MFFFFYFFFLEKIYLDIKLKSTCLVIWGESVDEEIDTSYYDARDCCAWVSCKVGKLQMSIISFYNKTQFDETLCKPFWFRRLIRVIRNMSISFQGQSYGFTFASSLIISEVPSVYSVITKRQTAVCRPVTQTTITASTTAAWPTRQVLRRSHRERTAEIPKVRREKKK